MNPARINIKHHKAVTFLKKKKTKKKQALLTTQSLDRQVLCVPKCALMLNSEGLSSQFCFYSQTSGIRISCFFYWSQCT